MCDSMTSFGGEVRQNSRFLLLMEAEDSTGGLVRVATWYIQMPRSALSLLQGAATLIRSSVQPSVLVKSLHIRSFLLALSSK